MHITHWVQEYGYIAILLGAFLEGETVLLIAGFAAYGGYLSLPWVVAAATGGSFAGDQLYFGLGKRYESQILQRFPAIEPRIEQVRTLIQRYHRPFILGIRFLYGLRTVGPIAIGMSDVTWRQYTPLNFLAALLWALAIGSAGYAFGGMLTLLYADIHRIEEGIIAGIAMLGVLWWWLYRSRHCKPSGNEP